jgi:hypothetical protein
MSAGGRRPRLLLSPRVRSPLSCGLLRPTVVLPAAMAEPCAAVRCVLAHELAHLRRGDLWGCLLFNVGQLVYFALPWFWRLRRQARLCQEYLADGAVVGAEAAPADYAELLVNLSARPALPACATSVTGNPSDLYRRVTMILNPPVSVEKRCPRWWSRLTLAGLASAALLASGLGLSTAAPNPQSDLIKKDEKKDELKKEDPKKAEPRKEAPRPAPQDQAVPDVVEAPLPVPLVPGVEVNPEELLRQAREHMKRMEVLRRRMANGNPFPLPFADGLEPQQGRLGVRIQVPNATLAAQLDLPKDQGLVVETVQPDSPAAKAGVKEHDILLEVDGKAVPSDLAKAVRLLQEVKADKAVDVVVLRKGKKETVQGLKLPEAKAQQPFPGGGFQFPNAPFVPQFQNLPLPNFPVPAVPPNGNVFGGGLGAGNGVMTSLFRSNDRYTLRHQEGTLVITLTGKVEDGKAKLGEVQVQDGGESKKYESVDKVPEQYRDKVKNLLEMTQKSAVKIELFEKAP